MDKLYIWKINGLELDLDMEDADTAERYSSAVRILAEADEIRNKDIDYSSAIRQYCAIFRKFYDFLFGGGTSEKIFDGIKDNRRKYDAVYESLLDFIRTQRLESDNRLSRMVQRYAPKKAKKMINLLFELLPDTVEVSGNFYRIATDFRDWIAFFDMLADEEITSRQKISLALQWFTDEIPPDIFQAYNSLISFASCDGIHFKQESEKSGNSPEAPSLSWLYDSAYVLGAFRQVYNIDLIRVDYMHWWEFSALFEALPEDTMIKKRMAYRQIKTSEIKDKNERKRIAKIKRSVAFPHAPLSAEQTAQAFSF